MTRKPVSVHTTHSFWRWLCNKRISGGEGSGLAEEPPLQCLDQNYGAMPEQNSLKVKYTICCLAPCLLLGQNIGKKQRPDFVWKHFPCKVAQLQQTALQESDQKPAEVSNRRSSLVETLQPCLASCQKAVAGSLCWWLPAQDCTCCSRVSPSAEKSTDAYLLSCWGTSSNKPPTLTSFSWPEFKHTKWSISHVFTLSTL